jgi:hypothetical protein
MTTTTEARPYVRPGVYRWYVVAFAGIDAWTLVFGDRPSWYARRQDGRRWSIAQANGVVVLEVTEPNGWTVEHRSEHASERAAKAAAKRLMEAR